MCCGDEGEKVRCEEKKRMAGHPYIRLSPWHENDRANKVERVHSAV